MVVIILDNGLYKDYHIIVAIKLVTIFKCCSLGHLLYSSAQVK